MQRRSRFDLSRRRLLQSLGLGAAAGQLFPLLNAEAQTATRPKRLILLYTPDGAPAQNFSTAIDWRPAGSETAFTFHEIHTPLDPHKAKIVVPWGLTMSAGGAGEAHAHGMAGLWTGTTLPAPNAGISFDGGNGRLVGWANAPSIDQLVARASGPNSPYQRAANDPNPETRYRSIALGVQCQGPNTLNRMTYTGPNAPIHPEVNPKAAFDRYFMGVTPSTGGVPPGPGPVVVDPNFARIVAEKKACVDLLKGEMPRIKARVGSADYRKFDAHFEALLAIERRNNATAVPMPGGGGGGGGLPGTANCTIPPSPATGGDFPTQIRQMMDVATHVLACDVTRVLTLQLSYAFSNVRHTWLSQTTGHHTMSHDGRDNRVALTAIDNWYAKQVAYFLAKLDSVNEGSGTLLDNSLVVWGREIGTTAHRMEKVPFILAGGAAGGLRTGRNLNFMGQQHAKLLVSVGQLMGLPMTSIGDRAANSGPLAGLV